MDNTRGELRELITERLRVHCIRDNDGLREVVTDTVMDAIQAYDITHVQDAVPEPVSLVEATIRYAEGLVKKELHPAEFRKMQEYRAAQIKAVQQDFDSEVKEINRAYMTRVIGIGEEAQKKRADRQ